jgi:hypothetical protein
MVRVLAYFSGVTVVCSVVSIRHARAEYQDQTLLFGRQMLALANASNHDVTKVIFNGQPMHVGSSVTQDGPATVLRRYEDYCKANRGQTDDDFGAIGQKTAPIVGDPALAQQDAPPLSKVGYLRADGDGESSIVCFVKGPKTKSTTAAAFESFMTTGELGAFGELRYTYTSKAPSGKTLVLTVWTDSQFNLRDMIGDGDKDVPGEDFAEVPRVPNSIRVISARAAEMPYGVNVYKSTDSPNKTLEYFDVEMKKAGWFTYDPQMTEAEHKGLGRAYMKNAVVVTLGTSRQAEGNFVAVGLAGVAADTKGGVHE